MPLMAYPLFMYIKHLKHLCFYTELILINSILLPISYIMYMDKQLQIWGGIHTPHLRDCRVSMNCH